MKATPIFYGIIIIGTIYVWNSCAVAGSGDKSAQLCLSVEDAELEALVECIAEFIHYSDDDWEVVNSFTPSTGLSYRNVLTMSINHEPDTPCDLIVEAASPWRRSFIEPAMSYFGEYGVNIEWTPMLLVNGASQHYPEIKQENIDNAQFTFTWNSDAPSLQGNPSMSLVISHDGIEDAQLDVELTYAIIERDVQLLAQDEVGEVYRLCQSVEYGFILYAVYYPTNTDGCGTEESGD